MMNKVKLLATSLIFLLCSTIALAFQYKIVNREDVNYDRAQCLTSKVLVSPNITEHQIKDIAGAVVKEIIRAKKYDAIVIFMYDRVEDVEGLYTIARAIWAPYGDWDRAGDVTRGDIKKYAISYDIRDKVHGKARK